MSTVLSVRPTTEVPLGTHLAPEPVVVLPEDSGVAPDIEPAEELPAPVIPEVTAPTVLPRTSSLPGRPAMPVPRGRRLVPPPLQRSLRSLGHGDLLEASLLHWGPDGDPARHQRTPSRFEHELDLVVRRLAFGVPLHQIVNDAFLVAVTDRADVLVRRAIARVVDTLVSLIVALPLLVVAGAVAAHDALSSPAFAVPPVVFAGSALVFPLLYEVALSSSGHRTLGKRLVGIEAVRLDGRPVSTTRALLRALLLPVAVLPARRGFWSLTSTTRSDGRRGVHDRATSMVVVRTTRSS